jgi:hypothetical protein
MPPIIGTCVQHNATLYVHFRLCNLIDIGSDCNMRPTVRPSSSIHATCSDVTPQTSFTSPGMVQLLSMTNVEADKADGWRCAPLQGVRAFIRFAGVRIVLQWIRGYVNNSLVRDYIPQQNKNRPETRRSPPKSFFVRENSPLVSTTMPPKLKLPAHLPQAWKYNNRMLEPGLTPALRRLYKDKIVLPEPEPLWSKSIKYGTYWILGGSPPPSTRLSVLGDVRGQFPI